MTCSDTPKITIYNWSTNPQETLWLRQDTNVLSNPWRWLVIAVWVFFLLIAIGIVTESAPEIPSETDRTISTVMGIGMILGALYVLFITWRKRVVLSRDAMLVCRGVRTTRYPREDVVGARYSDDLHEVGKFPIGFPVVDIMKGEEINISRASCNRWWFTKDRELYRRH